MKYIDFINDYGSTTKILKKMDYEYSLDVLYSDFDYGNFKRIALIKLNQSPVILGISTADRDSPKFLKILQQAAENPIGEQLFADNTKITRSKMVVSLVSIRDIKDLMIQQKLKKLMSMGVIEIYHRYSIFSFSYGKEFMRLDEYILPALKELFSSNLIEKSKFVE